MVTEAGRAAPTAAVRETHVSTIFFVGDRVYKLKKPVKLDFLDFSTLAAREAVCRREVELNRRLAPDVYLGVAEVRDVDGAPCDYLVVMRRMPEECRLSTLVQRGEPVDACVREVARAIAAFHGRAAISRSIAEAGSVFSVPRQLGLELRHDANLRGHGARRRCCAPDRGDGAAIPRWP